MWDDNWPTDAGFTYRNNAAPLAYRQELVDTGIGSSARFSFDGHAHDDFSNGLDAMLVGTPVFTAGRFGQAVALNGTTDYLQVSPRLGDSTDFSFTGWVLWNGGASWQRLFDLGFDDTRFLFLSPRTGGGLLRFAIQNGSGEQQLSAAALPTNVWTHVAVTLNGSTGKLFVNGVPVATNTGMNTFLVRVADTNNSLHAATLLIAVPTITIAVTSGADDAEQSAAGAVTLGSTDLEIVRDDATSSGHQIIGLRFNGLSIPQGAIITNATLQFTADEAQSEATALNIAIEAADHAAPFVEVANNLGARSLAPLTVPWTPAAWNVIGESNATQRTPNLAGLVQEIISRPGWTAGHALAFLITGIGHRTADAADDIGGSPAMLTVNYRLERALGSYARWAASRTNVATLTADLDLDGYENLFEYALGLDPAVPDQGATPLVIVGSSLHFTYTRPAAVTDVSYQVEWASTLTSAWSSTLITQQILSDDGMTRTIRATLPKGFGTQRFVRLKVTH